MYVIVKTGGKQYRLQQGEVVRIQRMQGETGSQVTLDQVLAASTEAGLQVGAPRVEDAQVMATIVRHGRGPKIHTFKYKRRKGFHKKIGHRQDFTEIRIDRIALGGAEETTVAPVEAAMPEPAAEPVGEPAAETGETLAEETTQSE